MPVRVGLRDIAIWKESLEPTVQKYEAQNDAKGQIVFYGPSYFTRWDGRDGGLPMADMIKGASGRKCVVNRGFGSSCSEHQLYYYPRMVRAIEPRVLVYGSYGNHDCFGYSIEETWELAQRVIMYALTDFPDIQIYICGACVHREMTEEQVKAGKTYDSFIKEFIKDKPSCHYINIMDFKPFTDPKVRERIFIKDGVHFNAEGYELSAKLYNEALKDELAKF